MPTDSLDYCILIDEGIKNWRNNTLHLYYHNYKNGWYGKVVVLISVDNYSDYCFGVAVERDMLFPEAIKHISGKLKDVLKNHPKVKPLFIMANGKEMLEDLEKQFKGQASFLFNPTLADERAMPAAKSLMEELFKNDGRW